MCACVRCVCALCVCVRACVRVCVCVCRCECACTCERAGLMHKAQGLGSKAVVQGCVECGP